MYDPSVGRWLTEDPTGFEAGDANLYRYVGNDPTDATDPTGTTVVYVTNVHAVGNSFFAYVPDGEKDPIKYLEKPDPKANGWTGGGSILVLSKPTPAQAAMISSFGGTESKDKALVQLLNLTIGNWVRPNIIFLSFFSGDYGSHCVRWTSALEVKLTDLPGSAPFWTNMRYKQFTLRYPARGGPEHSIILVYEFNNPKKGIYGIDNGGIGGSGRVFNPEDAIKNTTLPKQTRNDIQAALKEIEALQPKK